MAVITPNTDLILLKVPLEINDINQLDFANATAQFNYFNSLPKVVVEDYTYQRKDNTIRFGGNFDELITYNYCMYRNTEYSDKWFYAFIVNMEYINDNMTNISIKTDVWQTYMFDLTYKPCLIDREHTNDDTIGANTYPEGLELGEMVTNGTVTNFGVSNTGVGDFAIVVDVTMIENPGDNQTLGYQWLDPNVTTPTQYVNGIPSGLLHIIVGMDSSVITGVNDIIHLYEVAGLIDAIENIYILPKTLIGEVQRGLTLVSLNLPAGLDPVIVGNLAMPLPSSNVNEMGRFNYTRPTTINGVTPKNNKLFCFPYNYLNVSNNVGSSLPYHYEDFSEGVSFRVEGALTPSGSVKAIPVNYKGITNSRNAYDYGINGAKYPICSWRTDSYTNWLTQNAVNLKAQWQSTLVGGLLKGAGSAYEGMAGGLTPLPAIGASGVGFGVGIIQTAREQHLARSNANLVPDQVRGNANSGDVLWAKYRSPFTFIPMSIKAEYARCIDEYFSQFGYKTNRVKLPNITGRRNWNYVKTVGCYIEADIPQEDLAEIKDMFDKGITIWHNPATFADYSQNNDII